MSESSHAPSSLASAARATPREKRTFAKRHRICPARFKACKRKLCRSFGCQERDDRKEQIIRFQLFER
jgi:hypothetical protein